jgi:NTP pyrophosphatase (non-canonical NTP hydrolase)
MMNVTQFLLVKLAEECTELAKEALKAAEYGVNAYNKKAHDTNFNLMQDEYNDVLGCIIALNNAGIDLEPDDNKIQARIVKIKKNMDASRDAGMLIDR